MAILSDAEETLAINSLRFHADALAREARGHKAGGHGLDGVEYRALLRTRAVELRALADRLEQDQQQARGH